MPLLVTSLAPNINRLDKNGANIGHEYQQRCIDSWRGFSALSVNSHKETTNFKIRTALVPRDASSVTGKPLVFFSDLLSIARDEAKGCPFAITNSDVILCNGLMDRVANLAPGEFIYSRRIDTENPNDWSGTPFEAGFDFFACHPLDIEGFKTELVFGAPWWDHYLPIAMLRRGTNGLQLSPSVFHLKHEERWDWRTFQHFGKIFISEMSKPRDDYAVKLRRAIDHRTGRHLSDLKYHLWKRLPANAPGELDRLLVRVARANVEFLDSYGKNTAFV
jgi:hypothetical protein